VSPDRYETTAPIQFVIPNDTSSSSSCC
jgi:hypothetical protein